MLVRCCLMHINIIFATFLYQIICMFMLCLCDLFLAFVFIIINHIIHLKQIRLIFCYFQMITWMKETNSFQIPRVQPEVVPQLLFDFFANFTLMLLIKKACNNLVKLPSQYPNFIEIQSLLKFIVVWTNQYHCLDTAILLPFLCQGEGFSGKYEMQSN